MVYDPIRDREVPAPAVNTADAWQYPAHQPEAVPVSTPVAAGRHPYTHPAETPYDLNRLPQHPPSYSHQPSYSSPTSGTPGSSLRGLLNDPTPIQRTQSSSSIPEDAEDHVHRHRINRLLNNNVHPPASSSHSAQPLSKSNSASSQPRSSPSNPSPGSRHHLLDPNGFLTPATPASAYPRSRSTTSRSPHPQFSPQKTSQPLPQAHQPYPHEGFPPYGVQYGETGHRRDYHGASQMLPPQQPLHPHEVYDYEKYERRTPGPSTLPLRSPSISLSPRSQHQALPYTSSRPGSSASASHPFAFSDLSHPAQITSPSTSTRRLSEDQFRPPSSSSNRGSMVMSTPAPPARRSSQASGIGYPTHRMTPIRSPSPIEHLPPYDPHRIFEPGSVLRPISAEEAVHLRQIGLKNNPLRRLKARRPLPSWSGPSPGARQSIPAESDSSYFPVQGDEAVSNPRSTSFNSRHGSVGSSIGRPSITPTPGSAYAGVTYAYPPAFEEPPLSTPSTLPRGSANAPRGRKSNANRGRDGENGGNHLKRSSDHDRDEGGHDASRRKVSETHYVGNVAAVASHYNARPEVGIENRELSPIIGLKKFNNWVKSVLIGKFSHRAGAKVLDIGCGKGGDLNKWKQAKIRLYVGLDLAETSVDQARERYMRLPRPGFEAHFFAHDCFSKPISDVLPETLQVRDLYDNVTMQFCMHYAFESASKARMMIENVSRYLRKGGVFMGTIPNAELLLERLNALPEDDEELRFGNSCYYVQFAERRHKGIYGHQYRFFLTDAVEDVPEYIVNWDNFEALAMEYRLRLQYKRPFNDILLEEKETRDFGPLLGKMGVVNDRGESAMDADQWEAANLYMAFAFEKI